MLRVLCKIMIKWILFQQELNLQDLELWPVRDEEYYSVSCGAVCESRVGCAQLQHWPYWLAQRCVHLWPTNEGCTAGQGILQSLLMYVNVLVTYRYLIGAVPDLVQCHILAHIQYRPVSLCFDLQKIATEFILRLILSLYIYKYYLKNIEKTKHGKWENNKTVL